MSKIVRIARAKHLEIKADRARFRMERAASQPFTPRNAVKVFAAGVQYGRANAKAGLAARKI